MIRGIHATLGPLFGLFAVHVANLPALAVPLTGAVGIHDPSRILKEDGRYHTFATGTSTSPIRGKYSDNFSQWADGPPVLNPIPAWALAEVNPHASNLWAPDVFYFNNEYRLYYSFSSFGSQNSVIGLATNTTLDFNDPNYAWVDQGLVIESEVGSPYNAIDPAVFHDDATGRMWLTFGSFWNGIYITELEPATGKRITPTSTTTNVARNPGSPANAIEAPFLTEHDGSYYLFVNWGSCCQGVNSTYNIRVGKSANPTGPYVDRDGRGMTVGGGEIFLATEGNVIGPGHFSDFSENGIDYFSFHYYDGAAGGAAKLAIEEFAWTFDGWPILARDLPAGDYNRNGLVEAGDYTVWRNTLGSTVDLRANGNNIGRSANRIDRADYLVWKNNYGATYDGYMSSATSSAHHALPEPSTLGLSLLAVIALSCARLRATAGRVTSGCSSARTRVDEPPVASITSQLIDHSWSMTIEFWDAMLSRSVSMPTSVCSEGMVSTKMTVINY
jgi:arabinan endo-1,5-alpha-L-arabinosidase